MKLSSLIQKASAQTTEQPPPLSLPSSENLELATGDSLLDFVIPIVNFFLGLLGLFFVILLVYNAFKYLTAGSDTNKTQEAIKGITNAVIGVLIIGGAWLITQFVMSFIFSAA